MAAGPSAQVPAVEPGQTILEYLPNDRLRKTRIGVSATGEVLRTAGHLLIIIVV